MVNAPDPAGLTCTRAVPDWRSAAGRLHVKLPVSTAVNAMDCAVHDAPGVPAIAGEEASDRPTRARAHEGRRRVTPRMLSHPPPPGVRETPPINRVRSFPYKPFMSRTPWPRSVRGCERRGALPPGREV